MSSSLLGITSGEGDGAVMYWKGALCGRGEMSMESGTKLGEESGIGGVVTPSHLTGGVVTPSCAWTWVSHYVAAAHKAQPAYPGRRPAETSPT